MKRKQRIQVKRKNIIRALRFNLLTFVVLVTVGLSGFGILRNVLLRNTQNMGSSLAGSCASEMQGRLSVYETLLSFGADSLEIMEGGDEEQLSAWLGLYFSRVIGVVGENVIDPYAAIGDRIYGAQPWEGDTNYDFYNTQWYQKALENDGETAFTDVYIDAIYDRPVITISQKSTYGDAVLAFDIFPENLKFDFESIVLPEGGSYFLFDNTGAIIFEQTESAGDVLKSEDFAHLFNSIQNGEHDTYDSNIQDSQGKVYGVYYEAMPNGWYSVVTLPYTDILQNIHLLFLGFAGAFLIFLLLLGLITYRDVAFQKKIDRTDETVRVLGNSYYAIYRVDYGRGRFEMIKGSDYVRQRLLSRGEYGQLLETMAEVIEESARDDFKKNFSLENIKNLVNRRVRNFGGDFQRRFGDEYRWVQIHVLFDESLAPEEVVLCFREVNEEKHQQLKEHALLMNALASSRQSEKTKQVFFSNMSHDMRTPLNAIIGLADLAESFVNDPEKIREYIQKIKFSGKQLLELINDVLDISRMERGELKMEWQEFDLVQCIRDCGESFRYQAETDGKKFHVSCNVSQRTVVGDPVRIAQLLNNLLGNAFKFTGEGDEIRLELTQMENQERAKYQIVVSDTGIGMSEEFLKRIYEPYARETRFGARKVSGTGLGMSIVKNLVDQMEGHIRVESELEKGTTFTLVLPFETSGETAEVAISEVNGEAAQKSEERSEHKTGKAFSLKGRKILLAEDNEINMELATEILSMHGVEIVQAWNGKEAVSLFCGSKPYEFDAILMDMQMPLMNGCDAAKQIRASGREDAKSIPILAVTANAFAEDIAATTEAGMDAHISKPIDFKILCDTLEKRMKDRNR